MNKIKAVVNNQAINREELLFKTWLKKHGYSCTDPRKTLFNVLQNHNSLTIVELTSLLNQFDRATVYRTVKLFEKLRVIDRVSVGWKHKLELSNLFQHHHHHLVCTNCGRVLMLK